LTTESTEDTEELSFSVSSVLSVVKSLRPMQRISLALYKTRDRRRSL